VGAVERQRDALIRAIRRWANETRQDAMPLLLFAFHCLGHPEGDRPVDVGSALNPRSLVSLDALQGQLDFLIDGVGMGEDFVVTSLARALEEYLERTLADRERGVATFRAVAAQIEALEADPEAAAAFAREHGLESRDLPELLARVRAEVAALQDPEWERARRRDLESWRRAAAPLLDPDRREAWEGARFREAGQLLARFFRGPE
jgi:hypothetical protein